MKKNLSLLKASMSEGMNIFRISTKKQNNFTKIILPILLAFIIMGTMYSYAEGIMISLQTVHMEYVLLSLFILITSFLTLIEGIYKSSSLLFNCKDDNLLFSLPIKKSTVLFVRIFKFYLFELAYNSLFIFPTLVAYVIHMQPKATYYIVSFIGLLLFPILPILLSCIIGTFITFISSKFKGKNYLQTILTTILLLGIMYVSFNAEKLITNIGSNASIINDSITKIYYPAKIFVELVRNFNILKLFEFIAVNFAAIFITILLIGKFYFKINSNVKSVKTRKRENNSYDIKPSKPILALIKKEFSRFINSTVFITNAGFGLVLFVMICILFVIKFDNFTASIIEVIPTISSEYITNRVPVILFAFICFASFMTSITSSMISLEGKSFNILKSLPIKPYIIVKSKILAAIIIMIPCILIGDIIVFIRFKFDIISILLILVASILLPLLNETIGMIINLKYPKMNATNDTEVVKQSMSSGISVFIGMGLLGITAVLLVMALNAQLINYMIIISFLSIYLIIYAILSLLLHKTCDKSFKNIII